MGLSAPGIVCAAIYVDIYIYCIYTYIMSSAPVMLAALNNNECSKHKLKFGEINPPHIYIYIDRSVHLNHSSNQIKPGSINLPQHSIVTLLLYSVECSLMKELFFYVYDLKGKTMWKYLIKLVLQHIIDQCRSDPIGDICPCPGPPVIFTPWPQPLLVSSSMAFTALTYK